jgi:hypothetical protein
MSVEHLAIVLHHSRAKGTAKLVLLGIANHQGDGGAWPSVATLARYANVTERNVQKAVAYLVSRGELVVYQQQGGTRDQDDHRRPNRYDVTVSCPSWCDRTTHHRDTRRVAGQQLRATGVGFDTPPPSHTTPVPVSAATPKPSSITPPTPVHHSPVVHARERSCVECSQLESVCLAAAVKVPPAERHAFTPRNVVDTQARQLHPPGPRRASR